MSFRQAGPVLSALSLVIALAGDALGQPASLLGRWRFDQTSAVTEQGVMPQRLTNVTFTPSFNGTAIAFGRDGTPAAAVYPLLDQSGKPLLRPGNGAIRFWFKPGWSAANKPNGWMRILDWGVASLDLHPAGNRLALLAHPPGGAVVTNRLVEVPWLVPLGANDSGVRWQELVVGYSPSNTTLHAHGLLLKDLPSGTFFGPPLPAFAPGTTSLAIGVASDGTLGFQGAIDDLETWSAPLAPFQFEALRGRTVLTAQPTEAPAGLALAWYPDSHEYRANASTANVLRRRTVDPADWTGRGDWTTLATLTNTLSFRDANVESGRVYEYRIGETNLDNVRFLRAAVSAAPVESRGEVLVLVAENLAKPLDRALRTLREDLTGDGWSVVSRTAPVHDDWKWANNVGNLRQLKTWILERYSARSNSVKVVFLIGHVTIPYGGVGAEDGHPDNNGAWPADAYYGDVDGLYTDEKELHVQQNEMRRNVTDDGKFDQVTFPPNRAGQTGLELAVGRIDFFRLPSLGRSSEADLTRAYLEKLHRYRMGQLAMPRRVAVAAYFGDPGNPYGLSILNNSLRLASAVCGVGGENLLWADIFSRQTPAWFGLQGGYGGPNALNNGMQHVKSANGARRVSADFADPDTEPASLWNVFAGSYFMHWNLEDDFMRASLGGTQSGLVALPGFGVNWRFDPLGLGGCIGECMVLTSRGQGRHLRGEPLSYNTIRVLAILGDPTLRCWVTPPVRRLEARKRGGQVELTWEAPTGANPAGYWVYRSDTGPDGPFERISPASLPQPRFKDATPPAAAARYMVRALSKEASPSGSFTNLSQGVFVDTR
jgi:hypothetical protein